VLNRITDGQRIKELKRVIACRDCLTDAREQRVLQVGHDGIDHQAHGVSPLLIVDGRRIFLLPVAPS
jgi:hypothetical protein